MVTAQAAPPGVSQRNWQAMGPAQRSAIQSGRTQALSESKRVTRLFKEGKISEDVFKDRMNELAMQAPSQKLVEQLQKAPDPVRVAEAARRVKEATLRKEAKQVIVSRKQEIERAIRAGKVVLERPTGEVIIRDVEKEGVSEITRRAIEAGRMVREVKREVEIPRFKPIFEPPKFRDIFGTISLGFEEARIERERIVELGVARKAFEEATLFEKGLLTARTILTPRGFELIGAAVAGKPPGEVLVEQLAEEIRRPPERPAMLVEAPRPLITGVLPPEIERMIGPPRKAIVPGEAFGRGVLEFFESPVFEVEAAFVIGVGLGKLVGIPRAARILGKPALKVALGTVGAATLAGRGFEVKGLLEEGRIEEAIGKGITTVAAIGAVIKGAKISLPKTFKVKELRGVVRVKREAQLARVGMPPKEPIKLPKPIPPKPEVKFGFEVPKEFIVKGKVKVPSLEEIVIVSKPKGIIVKGVAERAVPIISERVVVGKPPKVEEVIPVLAIKKAISVKEAVFGREGVKVLGVGAEVEVSLPIKFPKPTPIVKLKPSVKPTGKPFFAVPPKAKPILAKPPKPAEISAILKGKPTVISGVKFRPAVIGVKEFIEPLEFISPVAAGVVGISIPEVAAIPKVRPAVIAVERERVIERVITKPAVALKEKPVLEPLKITKLKPVMKIEERLGIRLPAPPAVVLAVRPAVSLVAPAIQIQKSMQELAIAQRGISASVKSVLEGKRTPVGFLPPIPPIEMKPMKPPRKLAPPVPGFDVFVKRRRKKVAPGKFRSMGFRKANVAPLPRKAALGLGAGIVDKFVNRSFTIKKSAAPVRATPGRIAGLQSMWRAKGRKFRKSKSGRVLVERSRFAIDSPQEKRGIPYKAQRLRLAGLLPRKKRKARRRKR